MSEFVMGARLEMTDAFKSPMSEAAKATESFKQTTEATNNAMGKFVNTTTASTQTTQQFRDTLDNVAEATQEASSAAVTATGNFNRWKTSMQQFNRGTESIKNLPNTLKEIARSKLDGLENSMISTRLQAGLLVGGIKSIAQTKITSTVNSFKEFKNTVTEGKSGLAGFTTGLKNIGKISIANTYNTMKNLTSKVKEFANTKISTITNKLKEFKTNASNGEGGVKKLWTALKNAAGVGFSSVHTGITKIGSLAASAGSKVTRGLGSAITGITKGLMTATAAAGAAVGAVVAGSINVGKSFEAGMSTVASISGVTGSELKALEEKAKFMGATTSFSATEAAKSLEYMAMAGWKTDQMLGGIEGIMNLAAASGEDLGATSDIVTDALTAFNMKAEESGRFADVLAAASSNANTNVSMMGDTFKYVAPVAGALGYSVEDMGVAIGLMANAGIKGQMAGTQLRGTLSRMSKPTKETQVAMDKLGLSLTNSDGSMKDFNEVMVDMRKGFGGLTKDQQASYAAMLGGQEAMSGLLAIANASQEDFDMLTAAIDNSAGAAANMAAIKLDNLEGDITILKSGLEGLGIEIYQGIQQPLRGITQMATSMVSGLDSAFKKGGFAGLVGEIGNVFATIVTEIANAAPKVVDMAISLVDNLLTGIENNGPQIANGASKAVTAFVSGIMRLVPRVILVGADLILDFAQGIIQQLPELITTGMTAISTLVNGFTSRLPMVVEMALQLVQTLVNGLIANLPIIIQSGITLIVSLIQSIVGMLPSILQMALQLIMAIAEGLIANLPLILNAAVQVVVNLVQGIVGMLPLIIQSAIQLIITLFQGIIANLPTIIQAAVQIVVALAVGLIQAIPQLIAAIPQLVMAIIDTIMSTNWLEVGWDIVKGVGKGLLDGIKGFFGGGEKGGKEVAEGAAAGIQSNMGTVSAASLATADTVTAGLQPDYSVIEGYGATATTSLADGFMEASPIAVDAATSITTDMTDTFDDMDLFPTGKNAMEGLNDGLLAMKPTVMATARSMANSIRSEINSALDIHSPSRVMEESGEYTGEGLIVGISNMINRVKDAARGLGDSVIEPFATQATSQGSINPSGMVSTPTTRTEGLKIMIENIILSDVGNKNPKELVAEILKLLYEELSGADEVLSAGEMGALLT